MRSCLLLLILLAITHCVFSGYVRTNTIPLGGGTTLQCSLASDDEIIPLSLQVKATVGITEGSTPVSSDDGTFALKLESECYMATGKIFPKIITGLDMVAGFNFHFGGPCLVTTEYRNLTVEVMVNYMGTTHSCPIDVAVVHGPVSSVSWLVSPPRTVPVIMGIPISPAPVLQFVDAYGNGIHESIVGDKAVDVAIVGTSADSKYSLMGVTTVKMANGLAEFKDLITAGLLDKNTFMTLNVVTNPAFIVPPPFKIQLQHGVPYFIVSHWDSPKVMVDKCSNPSFVRIPANTHLNMTVTILDYFGNPEAIPLCTPGIAVPCVNVTSDSPVVMSAISIISPHVIQLDTSLLNGNISNLEFTFDESNLVNRTHFAVYDPDRIGCFPDIIFSSECTTKWDAIDSYFKSLMVTQDKHLFVESKINAEDRPLVQFRNVFKGYSKVYKEHDTSLSFISLTNGVFYNRLGYNYTRFWSMNAAPDYLRSYDVNFQYPFCSGIGNLVIDGAAYASADFQKAVITRWLSHIMFPNSTVKNAKYPILCNSHTTAISAYYGQNEDVTCCDILSPHLCQISHTKRVEGVSTALIVLQFFVAAMGTIYVLGLAISKYKWKSWENNIPYDVPIFQNWKHSSHTVVRATGFFLQRAFFTIAGCVVCIIFWCMCLAMIAKQSLLNLSVPLFVILSVTIAIWIIASATWYALESMYKHEVFAFANILIWGEILYFVCVLINLLVGSFIAFMFISWTSLGFIMDPQRVAAVFSAIVFIVATSVQIFEAILSTMKKGEKLIQKELSTITYKMVVFHVGMFVLVSSFLSTFIVIGVNQFDKVSVVQASASVALQFIISQGTKYLQHILVLQQELMKVYNTIESSLKGIQNKAHEIQNIVTVEQKSS